MKKKPTELECDLLQIREVKRLLNRTVRKVEELEKVTKRRIRLSTEPPAPEVQPLVEPPPPPPPPEPPPTPAPKRRRKNLRPSGMEQLDALLRIPMK